MHNQDVYADIVKAFEELKTEVEKKQAIFLKTYPGNYPTGKEHVNYFHWGSGADHELWNGVAKEIVKKALNLEIAIKRTPAF